MTDLFTLQKVLGVSFKDQSLLGLALIHSSYLNENPSVRYSNERLEFLGDSVLNLLVAEKLYSDFPHLPEGELTKLRAALVRRDALASAAGNIGLGSYLSLGKGEEASGGRSKPANLASALEAVVAAIFLEHGLSVSREAVLKLLEGEIERVLASGIVDYKSQLQELVQSRQSEAPQYRLVEVTGPEHRRTFKIEVVVGDKVVGSGSGRSKKLAEAEAAHSALKRLSK